MRSSLIYDLSWLIVLRNCALLICPEYVLSAILKTSPKFNPILFKCYVS